MFRIVNSNDLKKTFAIMRTVTVKMYQTGFEEYFVFLKIFSGITVKTCM